MKYKMVALDLDGTLLNSKKTINQLEVDILNQLHSLGIQIVIATGRNYYEAKELTSQISNVNAIILANNGSVIRNSVNDEILEKNYLDDEIFRKVYCKGLELGLNPVIHVDGYEKGIDIVYEKEDMAGYYHGYLSQKYARCQLVDFNKSNFDNILSICYIGETQRLNDFNDKMTNLYTNVFNTVCVRAIKDLAILEFLNMNSCKWLSLKKYSEHINILSDEIIAFGDDNNDIQMLHNVGLGIAMKNGSAECKSNADKISEFDSDNSGVFHELKKIFL